MVGEGRRREIPGKRLKIMHIHRPIFSALTRGLAVIALIGAPVSAQVRTVDPNTAIDADLMPSSPASQGSGIPADDPYYGPSTVSPAPAPSPAPTGGVAPAAADAPVPATQTGTTWQQDDLIGAAEGVFGKGAQGLAGIIERTLKDQGEPVAYIAGREASGAIAVGLRYGSGTLFHKIEGQREVYWTGPSVGFDLGGNAANSFVLVYNLHNTQDLFKRFPAGEGAAYFVGGFNASYLRWGSIVLIPIRMGVGYRLGANIGYMKFTEKRNWLPF